MFSRTDWILTFAVLGSTMALPVGAESSHHDIPNHCKAYITAIGEMNVNVPDDCEEMSAVWLASEGTVRLEFGMLGVNRHGFMLCLQTGPRSSKLSVHYHDLDHEKVNLPEAGKGKEPKDRNCVGSTGINLSLYFTAYEEPNAPEEWTFAVRPYEGEEEWELKNKDGDSDFINIFKPVRRSTHESTETTTEEISTTETPGSAPETSETSTTSENPTSQTPTSQTPTSEPTEAVEHSSTPTPQQW